MIVERFAALFLSPPARRAIASSLTATFLLLVAHSPAAEPKLLSEGRAALEEHIPEVAAHKLRKILETKDLPADQRNAATLLLGQACFEEGLNEAALTLLQPLLASADPGAILLQANILASGGQWAETLPLYQKLAGSSETAARVGEAESLAALGRSAEAVTVLDPMVRAGIGGAAVRLRLAALYVDTQRLEKTRDLLASTKTTTPEEAKWKKYLEARLLLSRDQAAPALILFDEILGVRPEDQHREQHPEHLPESLLFAATYGAAEARIARYGYTEAHKVMEQFIRANPLSTSLEAAFRRLDELYSMEESPPEAELHGWAQDLESRRGALALFYVAKMQVRGHNWRKAAQSLEVFLHLEELHARLPPAYRVRAYLMLADVYATDHQKAGKPRTADLVAAKRLAADDADLRAEIELRDGLAQYDQGEHVQAGQLFESAANLSPRLRQVSTFNSALAWLNQGNFEYFGKDYLAFGAAQGDDSSRAELRLEEGLVQARRQQPAAAETLKRFLQEFPGTPREAEANLALAELVFNPDQKNASPQAIEQAANYLQAANALPTSPETLTHAEYFEIFLKDAVTPRDDEKVISLAQHFLRYHSDSPLYPEVLMKLAQVYFRREDFANAESQFITLAEQQAAHLPVGPYAETALFLAGRSEMGMGALVAGAVDRALDHFEKVARGGGPLKLYARQEQAAIKQSTGHEDEAIRLYDNILESDPDPELREAALGGKGNNLRILGTKGDAQKLEEAVSVFDRLATLPGVSPEWRNQALYNKAKTLEVLAHDDDARHAEVLDTYYDILEKTAAAHDHEYFWYYKAGFDAAAIFEEQAKQDPARWKQAIAIYEKMVKFGGPRTREAEARIKQLRLEHFIWD